MKITIGLVGAVLVIGCKGEHKTASREQPTKAAEAAATAPAPAGTAARPSAPMPRAAAKRTPEALVEQLADPPKVAAIVGDSHAVRVVWNAKGEAAVHEATCLGEAELARAVAKAAQAAKGKVSCNGNVCVHYVDDERRNAFVFRPDGTLEGLLENIETADAAGTDNEVEVLHDRLAIVCPKTLEGGGL